MHESIATHFIQDPMMIEEIPQYLRSDARTVINEIVIANHEGRLKALHVGMGTQVEEGLYYIKAITDTNAVYEGNIIFDPSDPNQVFHGCIGKNGDCWYLYYKLVTSSSQALESYIHFFPVMEVVLS